MTEYEVVAKAVRMEHDPETDQIFLVFEIIDESFKQRIRKNWTEDIEMKLIEVTK